MANISILPHEQLVPTSSTSSTQSTPANSMLLTLKEAQSSWYNWILEPFWSSPFATHSDCLHGSSFSSWQQFFFLPKMWQSTKWNISVWKHVACNCKCYYQNRVHVQECTCISCTNITAAAILFSNGILYSGTEFTYGNSGSPWQNYTIVQNYMMDCMIMSYHIKNLQGGYRCSKEEEYQQQFSMRWHRFTGQIMPIVFAALPIIGNKL